LAVGFEFAEGGLYFPRKNGYEGPAGSGAPNKKQLASLEMHREAPRSNLRYSGDQHFAIMSESLRS
jgi:hypothetical protein